MVDIVIPVYKPTPDEDEVISIKQTFSLNNENITFVHPENMDISAYTSFGNAKFVTFKEEYFKDIDGYNRLMLSTEFYENFREEFILICQTDAFIFKDDLLYWCHKNYDYIGAPWLRSRDKIPFIKLIWDKLNYHLKVIFNYKKNGKWQKDKTLLYNKVGNGGLSLRKRKKCIEVLNKLPHVVNIYLKSINKSIFYAEDIFFSIEPSRNGIDFSIPDYKEACLFSIENKQEKALAYNNGILPFGCHRWNKEKNFWRKIFKQLDVNI